MSRFAVAVESQAAMPAGLPSGTTVNGYIGSIVPGSASNLRVRRLKFGVRAGASVPTSQQMSIAVFRQTVRAAGTGLATTVFQPLDTLSAASVSTGFDTSTASTFGTGGPTLSSVKLDEFSFNTQASWDAPFDFLEELWVPQGTANGLAFVNIGNPLPASHLFTIAAEIEE